LATFERINGWRRAFQMYWYRPNDIPQDDKFGRFKTFISMDEDQLEDILTFGEGPEIVAALTELSGKHRKIKVLRKGRNLKVFADGGGWDPKCALDVDSLFVRFMQELWEKGKWSAYDNIRCRFRDDIAYWIMGDKTPKPEEELALAKTRVSRIIRPPYEPFDWEIDLPELIEEMKREELEESRRGPNLSGSGGYDFGHDYGSGTPSRGRLIEIVTDTDEDGKAIATAPARVTHRHVFSDGSDIPNNGFMGYEPVGAETDEDGAPL
jgi:hypothetical protein